MPARALDVAVYSVRRVIEETRSKDGFLKAKQYMGRRSGMIINMVVLQQNSTQVRSENCSAKECVHHEPNGTMREGAVNDVSCRSGRCPSSTGGCWCLT